MPTDARAADASAWSHGRGTLEIEITGSHICRPEAASTPDRFDRDPPFTSVPLSFQVGYRPAYTDPRGRTFHAHLTFAFK